MNWRGVLGLRASGAAGKHLDRRARRARTRQASKTKALKEQQR